MRFLCCSKRLCVFFFLKTPYALPNFSMAHAHRYGQTGAGKSFTMEGQPEPPALRGIIPNSFLHIFEKVAAAKAGQQFLVRASYLEIYNEEVS